MGHSVNPSTGALTFNNTPSTVSDLQANSNRIEAVAAASVASMAALETIPYPREGEIRRVSADGSYWGFSGDGWELIHAPDATGTITASSGVSGEFGAARSGKFATVHGVDAQRTAAWTTGATIATVEAGFRPVAPKPEIAIMGATGGDCLVVVGTDGAVKVYGNTAAGSGGRVTFNATYRVAN